MRRNEIGKTQEIRLVDILALGPFMIWAGARPSDLPLWMRATLIVSGLGTIVYNASNYLEQEKASGRRRVRLPMEGEE